MKRTLLLLLIFALLCLVLSVFWPAIKESANAKRPASAIGGEYVLWFIPSEIVFALSMLFEKKGKKGGRV